jgi:nitrite reductase/ring-hydroxylating ferredoxin subunit
MTVQGADRPLLLCSHEGKVFALDNRCPHMGFPLSKGSAQEGILTCHWHHARFDLRSGCTFDLWADDAPTFEVRVDGDDIWVSRRPRQRADSSFHFAHLRRGLEHSIGLVQAKNIVALLARGEPTHRIVQEIAKFGSRNRRVWKDGMTTLTAVARLNPWLSKTTLVYALSLAARRVAANCDGQPVRHSRWRYPRRELQRRAAQPLDVSLGKSSPRRWSRANFAGRAGFRSDSRSSEPADLRITTGASLC